LAQKEKNVGAISCEVKEWKREKKKLGISKGEERVKEITAPD